MIQMFRFYNISQLVTINSVEEDKRVKSDCHGR